MSAAIASWWSDLERFGPKACELEERVPWESDFEVSDPTIGCPLSLPKKAEGDDDEVEVTANTSRGTVRISGSFRGRKNGLERERLTGPACLTGPGLESGGVKCIFGNYKVLH